jgi:hypothetical protein
MANEIKQPVLIIINREGVLIHVGEPEGFSATVIYSYAMDGFTIKTITFEEWEEKKYKLYAKITPKED